MAEEPEQTEEKEEQEETSAVSRENIIESENTENSTTYDAGGGVLITEFYSQDIRFQNEAGELVDYDPSLTSIQNEQSTLENDLSGYAYENAQGDKKQYFPVELTEETPILMEQENRQIRLLPIEEGLDSTKIAEELAGEQLEEVVEVVQTEKAILETEAVTDIYEETKNEPIKAVYNKEDNKTSYQYTSLDNGIKEEIVLTERPETNSYSFLLEIPGMTIRKNTVGEGLTIYADGVIVAGIHEPNMNDASGNAYSEDLSYALEKLDEEAGRYRLTLTVSEEYLDDKERQYPITIDPTLTWNDNSKVSDVYVLSNYPTYNYYDWGITSFYLGYGNQGVSRAFLALADLSSISKRYIRNATLTVTEAGNSSSGKTIEAFRITGGWGQDTVSWNSQPAYNGSPIARITTKGPYGTTAFDVTNLIQGYADRAYSNYGIMLKNPNESSKTYFTKFFGVRHASVNYRPKLTVEYYDRPAKPVSVKMSPEYIKPGQTSKIEWAGITAGDLSYVQYCAAEYNEATNSEGTIEAEYSANTKIGTTANGSANITVGSGVPQDSYKTYKVKVRGVGSSGAIGEENGNLLRVDNAAPIGTIKVFASGTAEEVSVLQDTVEIVGEVNGTGSPIKTSSMKLYDSTGKLVKDIYINSTLSKVQTVFTPELENGSYTLKMTMEDSVGFTAECEKQVTVVNKLAAPVLKSVLSNRGNVEIHWDFPYAAAEVRGLAYKLPGSDTWITVDKITATSGQLPVILPDAEGVYDVSICGIDAAGGRGEAAVVKCTIDKTLPQAEITAFERGLIFATISDANLSGWTVTIKKQGTTSEETVLEGDTAADNEFIGYFDMSMMETDVPYELALRVQDRAGNEKVVTQIITLSADDILAARVPAKFMIKRPSYNALSTKHIIFPANIAKMELLKLPLAGTTLEGETKWYCDGQLVSSEQIWNNNLPIPSSGTHSILAVIKKDGQPYYSRTMIKNRAVVEALEGTQMHLPKDCVAFRLNTGAAQIKAKVTVDGKNIIEVTSGETIYFTNLNGGTSPTAVSLKVEALNASQDTSKWLLELDCVDGETFALSESENYYPYDVGVKDKLNYKTYLRWNNIEGTWPQNISYEIYRGLEEGFLPSDENRIAGEVKANYWAEMNVNYSRTFYYRVRAVEKDAEGNIVRTSSYSHEIASAVIDADEYVKRMGLKEYWEYAEFETPSGEGNIEKSRGNLVYTQEDTSIPNEQLPVTLERTYNSLSSEKTAFGIGWTHSFDMELLNICKNDSLDFMNIVLKDGSGTLFFFNKKEDGTYISSMGKYVNLKKESKTEEVELPDKSIGVKDKTKKVKIISEFTLETKDNVQYRFNSSGQLIYMVEANGNFLLFDYEPNKGLLAKVTTSKNLTMEFTYYTDKDYEAGKPRPDVFTVKEVKLPDGSKVSYEYGDSKLTGVKKTGTDKTSTISWAMAYNDAKQLSKISDACGNQYQIAYEAGKASKVTYPNGEAISLKYNVASNMTTTYKEVTVDGRTSKILLEVNVFEPSSGNSIQMVDSVGNAVKHEYVDNLLSKSTFPILYQELSDQKVVDKTTQKTEEKKYSSKDNVTEETDEDGIKMTYKYDENAPDKLKNLPVGYREVNAESELITDETYKYDSNGNVIRSYEIVKQNCNAYTDIFNNN